MFQRRLLDALALINSSRSIAAGHFAIRVEQLDHYSKTSSLGRVVKSRVQKSYSNEQNAPFSVSRSVSQNGASAGGHQQPSYIPDPKSVKSGSDRKAHLSKNEGLKQDHAYDWSGKNSSVDQLAKDELPVQQEQSSTPPLPDGTILSRRADQLGRTNEADTSSARSGSKPSVEPLEQQNLSSLEARKAQRQAEEQIPSAQAEPPVGEAFDVDKPNELGVDQERDTFYRPTMDSSPVLSALPRVKLPKKTSTIQGSLSSLNSDVNTDTFYSSRLSSTLAPGSSEPQYEQEKGEITEDMMQNLFHSRKVASLFSNQTRDHRSQTKSEIKTNVTPKGSSREALPQSPTGQNEVAAASNESAKNSFAKAPWADNAATETARLGKDLANEMATSQQPHQYEVNHESQNAPFQMRESRVPSSRVGRFWQYAGLASSMTFGAVGEGFRRATGSRDNNQGSFMLSAANMERLVSKLSKMRGAALKIGQMLSFQDSKLLPAPIHDVLQRVQDSADYMPASQRDSVLAANLGSNWRELFTSFDEKPLAAASIGQVHGAVLKSNNMRVVVKVQYPGVATSIDSDLNNLSILLTASRLLPKGLYLDKTIANARTELAWECDYIRERDYGTRFRSLLADEKETFVVPEMVQEASGKQVLTMERMEGIAVTKIPDLSQQERDWIGTQILRLCLREIIDFHYMQTDPNWTNFLLNRATKRLELLDFGASREYAEHFITLYARNLQAASRGDRSACKDLSVELGYLTGYESKLMTNAHIDSVMTLAEPFASTAPEIYDFREQTITDRVKALIPVMLRERLSPPPEETYSLHRKLSGAFLLCARLGSRVRCREMFSVAMAKANLA
ncbi:MAG: hypothetical protein Q9160_002456 [Pyrenula sp. 1 TL-2023]